MYTVCTAQQWAYVRERAFDGWTVGLNIFSPDQTFPGISDHMFSNDYIIRPIANGKTELN